MSPFSNVGMTFKRYLPPKSQRIPQFIVLINLVQQGFCGILDYLAIVYNCDRMQSRTLRTMINHAETSKNAISNAAGSFIESKIQPSMAI